MVELLLKITASVERVHHNAQISLALCKNELDNKIHAE